MAAGAGEEFAETAKTTTVKVATKGPNHRQSRPNLSRIPDYSFTLGEQVAALCGWAIFYLAATDDRPWPIDLFRPDSCPFR